MEIKRYTIIYLALILICKPIFAQDDIGKEFITNISTNKSEMSYNLFSEKIKSQIPKTQLSTIWNSIINQNGKLKNYYFNCTTVKNTFDINYYTCEFENQTIDLKLIISQKDKKIEGFFFVPVHSCINKIKYKLPKYTDTTLFKETEIKIKSDSIFLNATLTLPNNKFENICLFIHGSGPNDRDETIGPNKIFKDLSIGLASQNIASIRFDKRTYSHKQQYENITIYEEVINDVLAVIAYLKKDRRLFSKNIYLIGHSLGGMLSPKIASLNTNVHGIIYLSANARSLDTLLLEQMNFIYNTDSSISDTEKQQLALLEKQINYLNDSITIKSSKDKLPLNLPASYWLSLKQYNQVETVKKLNIPMLFLQGERDYQVTMTDFTIWKNSLKNKKNIDFQSYKNLNHLFSLGKGHSTPKEYEISGNVPFIVIETISKWITKNQ